MMTVISALLYISEFVHLLRGSFENITTLRNPREVEGAKEAETEHDSVNEKVVPLLEGSFEDTTIPRNPHEVEEITMEPDILIRENTPLISITSPREEGEAAPPKGRKNKKQSEPYFYQHTISGFCSNHPGFRGNRFLLLFCVVISFGLTVIYLDELFQRRAHGKTYDVAAWIGFVSEMIGGVAFCLAGYFPSQPEEGEELWCKFQGRTKDANPSGKVHLFGALIFCVGSLVSMAEYSWALISGSTTHNAPGWTIFVTTSTVIAAAACGGYIFCDLVLVKYFKTRRRWIARFCFFIEAFTILFILALDILFVLRRDPAFGFGEPYGWWY